MTDEQNALRAFEDSQRGRNRIATAIVFVAICGFAGLKLYQWQLSRELSKPTEVRVQVQSAEVTSV